MMELSEHERKASLHGLGFAQIKLEGDLRLHVWHPDLPQRRHARASCIHDHRFGFVSTVFVGGLVNKLYHKLLPPISGTRYDAYNHDGDRLPTGNRPWTHVNVYNMSQPNGQVVRPGDRYTMVPYLFHSTEPLRSDGIIVTLMQKTITADEGATTLVEKGHDYDPDFDRFQMSEDDIMKIVKRALSS